ncbi:uncharacterized protein GGS22DRAFT_65182 [Annulohypoxylon maeteangense]|uniref:uncharacterized protein n=1 Tax=Annulohypoxylon maeteangense TaxID=1927788 RepID=UPI00200792C2|nr:uncharacterized protein GGS22DRAFT_65182 [Annulohypoxylon maeteangense]KAI0888938.1 hypothetical protein GGS22DRAFT_65182 [Annulohypoxylon maeteangense]
MREHQSSSTDIPLPLRVIKKGKSMQVLRSPRIFSNESLESGPDQPLTIVKNRKSQRKANVKRRQSSVNTSLSGHGFKGQARNVTGDSVSSDTWDLATPKPRKLPVCRRSPSLHVTRPLSPTFLTKLRSLSIRRRPSSKTTHHRDSRVLSGSSDESVFKSSNEPMMTTTWEQSSNSGFSEPRSFEESSTHRLSSGNTLVDIQTPDPVPDPYMLIPHVSITPESKSLNDGQSGIWTAVEISGQLFHPRTCNSTHDLAYSTADQAPFLPAHHGDTGLSRYGYLYNVRVDILPATGGSIINLMGDTVIRTMSPGSSLLILVCIQPGASKFQKSKTSKCDSDNLIADLELELGDVRIEYIHVRVNYCHSGFPAFRSTLIEDGITNYQTRLETTATGTINRYNPASAWSPRQTRMPNHLFTIIASHWGPTRAGEVMQRIVSNRANSCLIPKWASMGVSQIDRIDDTIKLPDRTGRAPPIPQRQASLRQLPPEKISDPARKIWTELRRTSSGNRPAFHVSKANRLPAATTFVDAPNPGPKSRPEPTRSESKSDVQRQRELIRETAVRNRRSIGADSLKSLVPSVAGSTPEGKENSVSSSPSPCGGRGFQFDGRKREGRWSLGSWW